MRATAPLLTFALALPLVAWPAPTRAPAETAAAPQQTTSTASAGRAARGALDTRCARCHDADGMGRSSRGRMAEIPDFSSHKWHASRSDAQLLASVLDGKGKHMPGYRGKLSEKEARDMVARVRGLDPEPAARPADAREDEFEKRFRELEEELADLKKRLRKLSDAPRKP